jgi:hypothetical protein
VQWLKIYWMHWISHKHLLEMVMPKSSSTPVFQALLFGLLCLISLVVVWKSQIDVLLVCFSSLCWCWCSFDKISVIRIGYMWTSFS